MRLQAVLILATLTSSTVAYADYETEQENAKLDRLEEGFTRFRKVPWFDGKAITPGTHPNQVRDEPSRCMSPLVDMASVSKTMKDATKRGPRYQALIPKHNDHLAYCNALKAAAESYLQAAAAAKTQAAADHQAQKALDAQRGAFLRDIPDIGQAFLLNYASAYDPKYNGGSGSGASFQPEALRAAKAGAEAVRAACKRHGPIADRPNNIRPGFILDYPTVICAMGEQGEKLIQKARRDAIVRTMQHQAEDEVKEAKRFIDGEEKDLSEVAQLRIFDRARWEAIVNEPYAPQWKEIGDVQPADAWEPAFVHDAAVKAKIDEVAPTRKFDAPGYKDGGAEGVAKAAWAKAFKGVKIRKIGTSYKDWRAFDEKTFAYSDDKYDYYRVNKGKNRYKRGWALLQIPGRPHCQAREWIVVREYNGPIKLETLGTGGTFMACE